MSRARAIPVLALVALATASCASSPGLREPWVYALSRQVYESNSSSSHIDVNTDPMRTSRDSEGLVWAVILALPFAVDTVLLPVTAPHDLFFVE